MESTAMRLFDGGDANGPPIERRRRRRDRCSCSDVRIHKRRDWLTEEGGGAWAEDDGSENDTP